MSRKLFGFSFFLVVTWWVIGIVRSFLRMLVSPPVG